MAEYNRDLEGFAQAYAAAHRLAKLHPYKEYALYVDERRLGKYAVSLAGLVRPENVAEGTHAHIIQPDGEFVRMFAPEEAGV